MKFRFLLFLLFVILTCASVQSKRRSSYGYKRPSYHPRPSPPKIYTTHTTYSKTGSGSSGRSGSDIFLHSERGGRTNSHNYGPKTTPRSVIRTTAAPTTKYPPWANPYIAPTQPTVVNKNNNYRESVPHTTRSPMGTQIYGGSLPKTQSTNRNQFPGIGSSSDIRRTNNQQTGKPGPGPYHDTRPKPQPFHKTNSSYSQMTPIRNPPPYPLYPVHPTPMQRGREFPQLNSPPPVGFPAIHTPMTGQNPHVMYPNQYPHLQPNSQVFASNPGGSYSGGSYSGSPFVNHGGQVHYPQQGQVFQSGSSPPVIVLPNQQDNGRGVGQILKEAIIYSGVNAAMNRIINPSHYHDSHYYHDRGYYHDAAPMRNYDTSNTYVTSHTYNNQYINLPPGVDGIVPDQPAVAQPNVPVPNSPGGTTGGQTYQPGSTIPAAPGTVGQPTAPGTATVGQPVAPGTTNVQPIAPGAPLAGQPAVSDSTNSSQSSEIAPPQTTAPGSGTASAPITNSSDPQKPPVITYQYRITDEELQSISEELFNKDEFNAYKYISLNIQGHSTGVNVSDQAAKPLFQVMPVAYEIPTVQAVRSLYQHYIPDSRVNENITMERIMKENILLDIFLLTNVMSITTKWLNKQGFVIDNDYEIKEMLRRLWFTPYHGTSSAFERVFAAEVFPGNGVSGLQDWISFNYHESNNRVDYLGYVDMLQFGNKAALLKADFRFDGTLRHNGTVFVGTSPELEMALYTICYYTRPSNVCPISLGGTKLNLFTQSYRYLDKDTIYLALPVF
ncbi:uncharacterized protein LOC107264337 [Cephus cinctus]|uniref:Uncharacterized protein LOC107264337 n=1 Tax=Cephus cinctus TaxID=211228 RepID=A0AAJ7FEL7_CEPCN|nr:uncharacterized protein LOC107264337 [Cephus cinctus]